MPIHDWTKAPAGDYHNFHQIWSVELCNALNAGLLPTGFSALIDRSIMGFAPDVLTASRRSTPFKQNGPGGAVIKAMPRTRYMSLPSEAQDDPIHYAYRANRVAIRTNHGDLVAVVELVSPGNKRGNRAIRKFRTKVVAFLQRGVHVSFVDLFPPTSRDPSGLHKFVWDEIREEPLEIPTDKPLTVASYVADPVYAAFVEPVAVGDSLPPLPIFLDTDSHVSAPLEETYMRSWRNCSEDFRAVVEGRSIP